MKSVIITGASGNLGQAVTTRLAQGGYRVHALLGRSGSANPFGESAFSSRIETQALDLSDEAATGDYVRTLIARDPAVEAAICIAGGWQAGTLGETTDSDFDRMLDINFRTTFHLARPLMEHFEQQGRGQFVFIGARPAINPAEAKNQLAYALSKSLIFRLAEVINEQGAPNNIRAGVVIPSVLDTPQNRAAMPEADRSSWTTPESAAETIASLLEQAGGSMPETVVKLYK